MRRLRRLLTAALSLIVVPTVGVLAATAPAHAMVPDPDPYVHFGPYTAKVDLDARGSMSIDDRTKTNAYLTGDTLYLICQDTGPSYGGSTIWDYTTDGYWEPDAYIKTGTSGFVSGAPRCLSIGLDGRSGVGSVQGDYKAEVDIDGRGSMNTADRIKYNAYLAGSDVFIKCQDYGPSVNSDTVWDYTADGYWIPDTYVKTGTNAMLPGMPRCSDLGIDGGASTNTNGGQRFVAATDLNGYSSKSLSSSYVDNAYLDGQYLTVMCQAYGAYNYGGSAIWDRTAEGYWVADYYVHTGSTGFVMSRCDSDGPSGGSGTRFLAETDLNGYSSKSLNSSYVNNKYLGGSYLTVVCQAYGEYNYGSSAVWDKTTDGVWVADYYVKTGSYDIVLSRCDNDPKPTGGPGNPSVPGTPPAGSVASSQMRDHIVNAVRTQVGVHEWGDNCNPYGTSGTVCGEPWCSIFASWAFRQAGIDVSLPYSGDFYYWAQRHGTLRSTSNIRPGDLVLFGSGPQWPDSNHVGVVVDVQSDGEITTIEGNMSNAVRRIGPYLPSQAASYHPHDGGIFAVVAPVNDSGDTRWGSDYDTNSQYAQKFSDGTTGTNYADPVCSQDLTSPDHTAFYSCVQMVGRQARGIAIADPSSMKAFGATVTLTVGGTVRTARCLTIDYSGYRTCATSWVAIGSPTLHADATFTVNGSTQESQRAFTMNLYGDQQTKGDYCGPASTQAALGTMGYPMPSQSTLASEEGTDSIHFTSPFNIPNSLDSRVSNADYKVLFWDNYGEGELYDLEALRQQLNKGRAAILLINPNNLPSSWDIETGTFVRHYITVIGYGAPKRTVISGVPYDIQTLAVWDPANDVVHNITLQQLADYTTGADFDVSLDPGTFAIIANTT
ncbi:hypothetical protein Athai_54270 [Actinocatenispora thailandica]|uniref:Peptidase C51 domain-containing protein n=1 Tax=Actinocatenispora thailandica TaxID=227318 RepID=A0A7R7HZZ4_9ACTN|nr:CHAP domain-containing protein [Actinocatenispora thailandica]BCJ37924.1 hypothetical protein Athai_54270 [Actinocatenispora thailandica]